MGIGINRSIKLFVLAIVFFIAQQVFAQVDAIVNPAKIDVPILNANLNSQQIYALAKPVVYRLSTRLKGSHSQQSHGTAFVVDSKGYLVTNFHVVLPYLESNNKSELVLEIANQQYLAKVFEIDTINDLALIKVPQLFNTVSRIAKDIDVSTGEAIYSLGYPKSEEVTMIQGIFNGLQTDGVAPFFRASIPLNSGMSGGPTLNSRGEVIAVNRAVLKEAQSISYLSPLQALQKIVANKEHVESKDITSRNWKEIVSFQVQDHEKKSVLIQDKNQLKVQKIGGYIFSLNLKNMDCGQDVNKNGDQFEFLSCRNVNLSLVDSVFRSLNFQVIATSSRKKINSNTASTLMDNIYNNSKKKILSYMQINRRSPASHSTSVSQILKSNNPQVCNARNITNIHNVKMLVRVCYLPLAGFDRIHNSYVKIDIQDNRNINTSFALTYEGLSIDATLINIKNFLNNIKPEGRS